jgi:hypothetical protein
MGTQDTHQSGSGWFKRLLTLFALFCMVILAALALWLLWARESATPAPPINPAPPSAGQLNYPYELVPGDPRLDFPTAEGRQLDMDSDTWFLEGVLEGQQTGRRFSFIVVYFVSRIYGVFPFNFYSLTFYDLDKADYGTATYYDVGRMKASTGFLDLSLPVNGEEAMWTTAVDDDGYLVPFTYRINLPGVDQHGRDMQLTADVRIVNPPVAVGADTFNGLITVLKQQNTYSYFQTGVEFDGVLSWGDHSEPVKGRLGHMDRQMFPLFSGVHNSRDGRNLSHEWRTYFLDNGTDFSSWRQFDRTDKNAEYSYGGATTYHPAQGARYAGDIVYENLSYVRTENHPVKPLVPPRSTVLYFPNRHRLSSAALDLELLVEPIVEAPLLAFPVEYMHGPALLRGTQGGQPVNGIGSFEMTLHLYRDFELVTVLSDSVRNLPADAVLPSSIPLAEILGRIAQIGTAVDRGDTAAARSTADGAVRDALLTLAEPYRGNMLQILDDLVAVL